VLVCSRSEFLHVVLLDDQVSLNMEWLVLVDPLHLFHHTGTAFYVLVLVVPQIVRPTELDGHSNGVHKFVRFFLSVGFWHSFTGTVGIDSQMFLFVFINFHPLPTRVSLFALSYIYRFCGFMYFLSFHFFFV
jgi:hypothetical protein